MALAASKSTSKGEISASSAAKRQSSVEYRKKNRLQRSKSMSGVTRSYTKTSVASAADDLSVAQFLIKRDNPLFCFSNPSSPEHEGGADGCSVRRGRSVLRSFGYGNQTSESRNQSTRSLSRVGYEGRVRAIPRVHYDYSESEEDVECKKVLSLRAKMKDTHEPKFQKNKGATSNGHGILERRNNFQTWSSRHPVSDYCNTSSSRSWEDGISITSLSELEETTIREAIWRKNFADSNLEVGPEMVNQDTIDLVSDIRMEYEAMLNESHERARKLRADLAVEEQREQEICRILNEIISDENSARKSQPRKTLSIERFEMSRRLAEDAMSYFDECVSISTFNNSDFSSNEDQQPSSMGIFPPLYNSRSLTSDVSTFTTPCTLNGHLNHPEEVEIQSQCSVSAGGSNLAAISSCSSSQDVDLPLKGQKYEKLSNLGEFLGGSIEIPSVCEAANSGESHDFRAYIKRFEKEPNKSSKNTEVSSSFNINDYDFDNSAESLLLDIVLFKNRIESGSLLLCDIRTF